jgi:DNA-binding HxlR family transcriptional regulator
MKKYNSEECTRKGRAVQDTLDTVSGKWKVLILVTLLQKPFRFKELAREIGISPRMLSRELQDIETNKLISRTVRQTKPLTVEYAITPYGKTIRIVLMEMLKWGETHRKTMLSSYKKKELK